VMVERRLEGSRSARAPDSSGLVYEAPALAQPPCLIVAVSQPQLELSTALIRSHFYSEL
jgi:hypothetical protein